MKDLPQQSNANAQLIETDYINDMLGIDTIEKNDVVESRSAENTEINNEFSENINNATTKITEDNSAQVTETVSEIQIDFNAVFIQPEIECNIFHIQGLQIAVPISSIAQVLQQPLLNDTANAQIDMHIGQCQQQGKTFDIIDLAYPAINRHSEIQDTNNIVLFKSCSIGFIYEQHSETQIISTEEVCWRDDASQRLWLAGTVAQKGLCLLDIEGLIQIYKNSIGNNIVS